MAELRLEPGVGLKRRRREVVKEEEEIGRERRRERTGKSES